MRILVASHAVPGHALLLTGPARRLLERGHTVRWYTGESLRPVVERLGMELVPFRRAVEHTATNLDELYPGREKLKGPMQTRFDGKALFADTVPGLFADLQEIHQEWAYDVVLLDASAMVARLLREKIGVPVVAVFAIANMQPDPLVPPLWFGLRPDPSLRGRVRDAALRRLSDTLVMGPGRKAFERIMAQHGITEHRDMVEDAYDTADAVVQQGLESFDFPRSRKNPRVHYVGPLLPWSDPDATDHALEDEIVRRAAAYPCTVLVTQGTVDLDLDKLLVPTLEACRRRGERTLVVATTCGVRTDELRGRFAGDDVVIADRLDFRRILDHVDVFVTNGGFGGTILALTHGVPLVCAGFSEGKNDTIAHVVHHGVGVDLRTEKPDVAKVMAGIDTVRSDPTYAARAMAFREEAAGLDPDGEVARLVEEAAAGAGSSPGRQVGAQPEPDASARSRTSGANSSQ